LRAAGVKLRSAPHFILTVFLAGAPISVRAEDDRNAAAAYMIQAQALYDVGDVGGASRLASAALEFFPASSEGLYLRGRIALLKQETTLQGIESIRRAIAASNWTRTDPDTASKTLAHSLLRIGAVGEALTLLQKLVTRQPEDPENRLFLAQAFERSGRRDQAQKTIDAAVRMFPNEEGLYLFSSMIAERAGRLDAARTVVALGLSELGDSLPLFLRSAVLETEESRQVLDVDGYVARGGTDPLASVIALEAQPKDPDKYLSLFFSMNGLSRLDLTQRACNAVAGSPVLLDKFTDGLARFSGTRDLPGGEEGGFYEERWTYTSGQAVSWIRDANQDGVPELRAELRNGIVDTLSISEDGGTLTFHFDRYPAIDSASVADSAGNRTYFISPRTLGCVLYRGDAAGGAGPSVFAPTLAQIISAAFRQKDYSGNGSVLLRSTDLSEGKPVYAEEDLDGDGKIDHRIWYSGGKPVRGDRDLGADGSFNEREEFRDGLLWRRTVDSDGDGKIDYAEQVGGAAENAVVKMWDYNEDGVFDSRESRGANGTVIREFSTGLDGGFDLRIVFKAEVITSVQKDGKALAVTPDPKNGIVWIGAPMRGARVDSKGREGIQILSGKPYLLFRFADATYLEELR
jgi:tetratricopeptide (TPR) repeat protein